MSADIFTHAIEVGVGHYQGIDELDSNLRMVDLQINIGIEAIFFSVVEEANVVDRRLYTDFTEEDTLIGTDGISRCHDVSFVLTRPHTCQV